MAESTRTAPFAGSLVSYWLVVELVLKTKAALGLMSSGHSVRPLLALLPGLGTDLVVLGGLSLLLQQLARFRWTKRHSRGLLIGTMAVSIPLAAFSFMSLQSFAMTGTYLTRNRLRGDDGVTLTDLDLLTGADLWPTVIAIALVVVGAAPLIYLGHRTGLSARLQRARVALSMMAVGLVLVVINTAWAADWGLGLEEHPIVEFLWSLGEDESNDAHEGAALSVADWAALHKPRVPSFVPDAPPRPARPRGVILYLAEGIPLKHTSLGHSPFDPTPNLARRAEQGLFFRRYYAHYHKSIHALFSVVCSQYPPPYQRYITTFKPDIDCGTLMENLALDDKMHQGLFHGGYFDFSDKLGLLGNRGFEITLDANDLSHTKSQYKKNFWGIDDRAVVAAVLEWLDTLPTGEPFFAFIVPIAPHYPYAIPKGVQVPAMKDAGEARKYLRAVHFADQVFEQLMVGLDTRGLTDDTMVLWLGDHGEMAGEPERPTRGKRMLYEANVHTPLVLLNPKSYPAGKTSDRLGSHIDLAPTILDLFGKPRDPRHLGQSLLSSSFEPRRVYLSKVRGNAQFIGIVDGRFKFLYELKKDRTEYYDLFADPEELVDLSDAYPARIAAYKRDARRYREGMLQYFADAPTRKSLSVIDGIFAAIDVSIEKGDTRYSCARDQTRLSCPELGAPHRDVRIVRMSVERHPLKCVQVPVPPGSTTHVRIPASVLERLSLLRIAWRDGERRPAPGAITPRLLIDEAVYRPRKLRTRHSFFHFSVPHRGISEATQIELSLTNQSDEGYRFCLVTSDLNER